MKISSGWRICYCNTRGPTSNCQRDDIQGPGQELGICSSREGRHGSPLLWPPCGARGSPPWHRTQAPGAGGVLDAAPSPPSRTHGRSTRRTRGPSDIISRPVSSAEKQNKQDLYLPSNGKCKLLLFYNIRSWCSPLTAKRDRLIGHAQDEGNHI